MIPYLEIHTIPLGPINLQFWGTMVALGFVFGTYASVNYAKSIGLQEKRLWDALVWVLLGAVVMSRVFHVLFYELGYYLEHPWLALAPWESGFSVIGGFVGAVLLGWLYLKINKLDFWKYFSAGVFGLPLGLFIGRIGCAFIHDHPGTETSFFLGIQYPDGIIRHDHGLYLSLNGLILFLVFVLLRRYKVSPTTYPIVFLIWYGLARFVLDFTRAVDVKYLGLTPAQYSAIGMIILGLFLAYKFKTTNLPERDTYDKLKLQ